MVLDKQNLKESAFVPEINEKYAAEIEKIILERHANALSCLELEKYLSTTEVEPSFEDFDKKRQKKRKKPEYKRPPQNSFDIEKRFKVVIDRFNNLKKIAEREEIEFLNGFAGDRKLRLVNPKEEIDCLNYLADKKRKEVIDLQNNIFSLANKVDLKTKVQLFRPEVRSCLVKHMNSIVDLQAEGRAVIFSPRELYQYFIEKLIAENEMVQIEFNKEQRSTLDEIFKLACDLVKIKKDLLKIVQGSDLENIPEYNQRFPEYCRFKKSVERRGAREIGRTYFVHFVGREPEAEITFERRGGYFLINCGKHDDFLQLDYMVRPQDKKSKDKPGGIFVSDLVSVFNKKKIILHNVVIMSGVHDSSSVTDPDKDPIGIHEKRHFVTNSLLKLFAEDEIRASAEAAGKHEWADLEKKKKEMPKEGFDKFEREELIIREVAKKEWESKKVQLAKIKDEILAYFSMPNRTRIYDSLNSELYEHLFEPFDFDEKRKIFRMVNDIEVAFEKFKLLDTGAIYNPNFRSLIVYQLNDIPLNRLANHLNRMYEFYKSRKSGFKDKIDKIVAASYKYEFSIITNYLLPSAYDNSAKVKFLKYSKMSGIEREHEILKLTFFSALSPEEMEEEYDNFVKGLEYSVSTAPVFCENYQFVVNAPIAKKSPKSWKKEITDNERTMLQAIAKDVVDTIYQFGVEGMRKLYITLSKFDNYDGSLLAPIYSIIKKKYNINLKDIELKPEKLTYRENRLCLKLIIVINGNAAEANFLISPPDKIRANMGGRKAA